MLVVALLADLIAKRVLLVIVARMARRTTANWDDLFLENKVFARVAQLVPALIISVGIVAVPQLPDALVATIRNVANAWVVIAVALTVTAVLTVFNRLYEVRPEAGTRPIKGFVQLLQIAVWIIAALLAAAVLIDRSPVILLSGLGAMTAVLLLVFKDTILSLVASLQLTGQDMIRVGDWLEMPQFGADGDVIDVTLYTVKVQNWDKTITTIPTYRLVSDAFRNWRGMTEAGGRRIKRSIYIDLSTVRFLNAAEILRFRDFALLRDYIDAKERELQEYNAALETPGEEGVNLRRLTNIGTLRAYVHNYLRNHPRVRQDLTLIVRQLQPGPEGLPLEIYCFSNDTAWASYEGIQADIFDHICAIVPQFGLRLYQQPSGADVAALTGGSS